MMVIVSQDTDFSHSLAEQVVRELGIACECLSSEEAQRFDMSGAQLIVTDGKPFTQDILPVIVAEKPVRLRELLTQISTRLRMPRAGQEEMTFGAYRFSLRHKTLSHGQNNQTIDLTDKESQLLAALLAAGGKPVAKEILLKQVWGFEDGLNTHTLETHIYRLRSKFKDVSGNEMIIGEEGGYRVEL